MARKQSRSKKKSTVADTGAGEAPPVGPVSEFRSDDFDAWYSVNLVLKEDTLIVKYRECEDDDEEYNASELKSLDEIIEFGQRFRPLSKQLEASDCCLVREGVRVCALRVFDHHDYRFYDAFLDAVKREEHTVEDGAEKCSCSFLLSWLHGPEAGTLTIARIEDLCPIQSRARNDPRLTCFLEIAKWKHGITSLYTGLSTENLISSQDSPISFPNSKAFSVIPKSAKQMQNGSELLDGEGILEYESNEDVDLGGGDSKSIMVFGKEDKPCFALEERENPRKHLIEEKIWNGHTSVAMERLSDDVSHMDLGVGDDRENKDAHYFVLVENLEKDLCPSTIVDFVREVTSLEIEAFVFSSSSIEPYAKGALAVNSVEDLEQLCNFLSKEDQIITSLRGRPWLVSDSSASDSVRTSYWCLESDPEIKREHSDGDGLKVVKVGSEEYRKVKKLRDLFLEFAKHQERLLKRLVIEEQDIFNS